MKIIFYILLLAVISQPVISGDIVHSPLSIVNQRMDSYNRHDLKAFLSTYSEEVKIYTYPDKQLAKGKDNLASIFEPMFKEQGGHVTIHYQIEKDSYVINHETVAYAGKKTQYVSIYKVVNGLITEVRFVRD
ncbi:MAG: nuclear transport factor 2 family protein [Pseudomonadota bacterium]